MEQQSINTSASPEIEIEQVDGNLQVKGWENPEVLAKSSSGGGLTLDQQEDGVRLSCHGDCVLRVPYGAAVRVQAVHGDVRIKSLEEPLSIQQVDGSLSLRDVADINLESVHGNLEARRISGNFHAGRVDGNVQVRDLDGDFSADLIHGNLELAAVEGVIRASADGNASLRLYTVSEGSYQVTARGNLNALVPEDASLKVNLASGGQAIALDLPEQRTSLNQGSYSFTMGDGEAEMALTAGGNVSFKAETLEWASAEDWDSEFVGRFGERVVGAAGDFSQQLSRQIEEQVQAQMARLNEQMSRLSETIGKAGLSEEEAERVMRQAQETAEQATARAQEKIARAQERLARKMEAASRKAEQRAKAGERHGRVHSFSFQWPRAAQPPVPPKEAGEPVTDEERMMILRMLEQKKITPEEAEKLLAALEGKG